MYVRYIMRPVVRRVKLVRWYRFELARNTYFPLTLKRLAWWKSRVRLGFAAACATPRSLSQGTPGCFGATAWKAARRGDRSRFILIPNRLNRYAVGTRHREDDCLRDLLRAESDTKLTVGQQSRADVTPGSASIVSVFSRTADVTAATHHRLTLPLESFQPIDHVDATATEQGSLLALTAVAREPAISASTDNDRSSPPRRISRCAV